MQLIYTTIFAIGGYILARVASHPNSKINSKLPKIKLKNIYILPSLKISIKGKILHLHHWFNFTVLLCLSIFVTGGILDSWLTRGFLIGGIIQGLRFPDRSILQKKSQ